MFSRQTWNRCSHFGRYCLVHSSIARPAESHGHRPALGGHLPPSLHERAG
jgi:hypothetical protein